MEVKMSGNPGNFKFHGGLHLDEHKAESLGDGIQTASLPDELVLRVSQHIGEPNSPLVKVGDEVKKGQLLAESLEFVSAPVHAPTSGKVIAIENRPIAHASGQTDVCIIIKPDGLDATGTELEPVVPEQLTQQQLLSMIRKAGIVGLGGAVFPTAAKLDTAIQHGITTLVINGAECEPYITCDDILMQTEPGRIVRGIQILQTLLQPQQTLIGIEDNKPEAIKTISKAVADSDLANTRVVTIPTLYPSGGEKQLIKILTGEEVISGELSFKSGFCTQNVGTCAAIADAVDEGLPLLSRVVTVTGPGVQKPGNWLVALGTPFSHLIKLAGGYTVANPRVIMGGPMMGLPLTTDQVPVVKATNTILVLNQDDQPQVAECIRCGQCAEVCPARLLPQQLYWFSRSRQFDSAESFNLFDCIECGCCAAVCPSHIPLVQYYRYSKSEIWEQRRKTYKSDRARKRHEFREARILRQKQQDEERRRQKREALEKKKLAEQQAKSEPAPDDVPKPTADAVQAALERVKARKQMQHVEPKNTDNLTPAQQRQIDEAEARRRGKTSDNP
jgi:Na+-translocating ferredoxin:NAD+ oxidoreductase subunit C